MRLCAKNLFSDCFLAEAFISRVSASLVSKAKKTGEGGEKRQFHNQEGLISIWLRPFSNLPTNEFLKKTTTAATCYTAEKLRQKQEAAEDHYRKLPHLTVGVILQFEHNDLKGKKRMILVLLLKNPRCLKITEKVSFNVASEASYILTKVKKKLQK